MARPKTWLRRLGLILGLLVVVLLAGLAAGLAAMRSEAGRAFLRATIERQVSDPQGLSLTIARLEGALPHEAIVEGVVLADPEGTWMTVERAVLRWSPWRLLTGRVVIEELSSSSIVVERAPRLPEAPAAEPAAPAGLPLLPVDVVLERLQVDGLRLGAALLGEPVELTVSAALAAPVGGAIESSFEVRRLGGASATMAGRLTFDPGAETASVDLELSEPAGGLISRLAGLPGASPVSLSLEGQGPLDDWQGRLRAAAGAQTEVSAEIALSGETPRRLILSGDARLAGLVEENLAGVLEQAIAFELDSRWQGFSEVELRQLRIAHPAALLTAGGRLDLETLESDLSADLEILDDSVLKTLAQLSLSDGRLHVELQGPLTQPDRLLADLAIEELQGPAFAVRAIGLRLTASPTAGQRLALEGEGRLDGLRVDGLPRDELAAAPIELALEGSLGLADPAVTLDSLRATRPGLALVGSGTLRPDLDGLEARALLDVEDPLLLERLAGTPLSAAGRIELSASSARPGHGIELTLDAALESFRTRVPAADALLGPRPAIQAAVRMEEGGRIVVERATLEGARARLAASAVLPPSADHVTADYRLELPAIAALSAPLGTDLSGQVEVAGSLIGPFDDLAAVGRLTGRDVAVGKQPLAAVRLDYDLIGLPGALNGHVSATSRIADRAVALDSELDLEPGARLTLSDLTARLGEELALAGEVALALAGGMHAGRLRGRLAAPQWVELPGRLAFAGDLDLSADLGSEGGRQRLALEVDGRALHLWLDGSLLSSGPLRLDARLDDLLAAPRGELSGEFNRLAYQDLELDRLALSAQGDLGSFDVGLSLRGDLAGSSDLELAATIGGAMAPTRTITLRRLAGQLAGLEVELEREARLLLAPERQRLEDLALRVAGGRLEGGGQLTPGALDLELALRELPLGLLAERDLGPPLSGELAARMSLSGDPARPQGDFELSVPALSSSEGAALGVPPVELAVEGRLEGGELTLSGRASGFADRPLTLEAALPLDIDLSTYAVALPETRPLRGSLAWQGQLGEVARYLPLDDQELDGQLSLDLAAEGTLGRPRLVGGLTLRDGRYQNIETGTRLADLSLDLTVQDRRLVLSELSATDGEGGRLAAAGNLLLDPERDFPLEAELTMNGFRVTRMELVTATADAGLAVRGSLADALLSGSVTVTRAEIQIPNRLPPEVVVIDVTEVRGGRPVTPEDDGAAGAAGLEWLRLDVSLAAPQQIFVRGRGLDSEWGGQFDIAGTAAQPDVKGALRPIRGQFALLGKVFTLREGSITLPGGTDSEPRLDLAARYEEDGFAATVRIGGTASAPSVSLSSSPQLPEDEIVSRILFGRGKTTLTPLEALELADAVATLSGRGGGGGVLDLARKTIGVDVLRVGTDEAGQVGVTAGQYVTENVFLGVEQGITPGSTRATVEVEVTPNVTLESSVGAAQDSSVGVRWQWDY